MNPAAVDRPTPVSSIGNLDPRRWIRRPNPRTDRAEPRCSSLQNGHDETDGENHGWRLFYVTQARWKRR